MVSIYVLYTTSMVVYTPMYTIVVVCSSGLVVSVSPSDLVLGDVEVYLVPTHYMSGVAIVACIHTVHTMHTLV